MLFKKGGSRLFCFGKNEDKHFNHISFGLHNIEAKIFIFFLVPIVLITTTLSILSYKNAEAIVTELHGTYMNQIIDNVESQVDRNMNIVQKLLEAITLNDLIIGGFNQSQIEDRFNIYRNKSNDFIPIYIKTILNLTQIMFK